MKLSLSLLGAAVALFGLASDVRAQVTPPSPWVLEAVDKYRFSGQTLYLTGTLKGAAAPFSSQVYMQATAVESCERILLTAINRPGRFFVTIEGVGGNYATCALERRP
jgi:hypothetical protein